jgi:hypothetical protein
MFQRRAIRCSRTDSSRTFSSTPRSQALGSVALEAFVELVGEFSSFIVFRIGFCEVDRA